jgi:uncharacterized protein
MKRSQRRQMVADASERDTVCPSAPEDATSRGRTVRDDGGRLLISLRVTPYASRDAIALESDGLRVRLTAPPVEGAANEALISLLAARLCLPKRAITLTHGATARQKTVAVAGICAAEFWERLEM